MCGKALPRSTRGTLWKKAPNDCDHPPTAIQKGGSPAMCYERCEMCGNRLQRIPLTVAARDPETTLNNRTGHESITQATPQQRRRKHGSHWGRRDTVPLKVQGQLKGVDQEACLQLIYETGQRPESPITTRGLVPRQEVELGDQVTESFNILEGFFSWMVLDSQPTKSIPRRVRPAIEMNTDAMCPNRDPQSRMQHENLDVRSVGTTRPLRGVALFDETCDSTDEEQESTVRACRSVNPGIIIVGIPRTAPKTHFEFCMTLCMATRSRCSSHHEGEWEGKRAPKKWRGMEKITPKGRGRGEKGAPKREGGK